MAKLTFSAGPKYNASGEEQWAARYNGPGNKHDLPRSLAVDQEGNVYVTGGSWGGDASKGDFATVKYNSSGEEQWVARYDGPHSSIDEAKSVAVDAEGNVYVTGNSWSNETTTDYATVKYNSSGEEQWVARYDGPRSAQDEPKSVAVDAEGNVYVTGLSMGEETGLDYATLKYNALGDKLWEARYNSLASVHDRASSLAIDADGNVYVTGFSEKNEEDYDYATVKYNTFGEEQWAAGYDGPGHKVDEAKAIGVDGEGNVYVTGHSLGYGTGNDYATLKYNASGEEQWAARYHNYGTDGGDMAKAMAIDAEGNIYVTGQSKEGLGHYDYATLKYNASGEEQWIARYRSRSGSDYAKSIALDVEGNVYVTGYSWGYQDFVTVKYRQESNAAPELVAPSELTAEGRTGSEINLHWQDNTADEDSFVLERATNPDFTGSVAYINLPADKTRYEDKNKKTGVTFYYRIKAVRGEVSSDYSEVVSAVATGNQVPVVEAGEDKVISISTDLISFTAKASDPDGEITAYLWEQVNGPTVNMSGENTATLSLSEFEEGSYTFEVTVTDDEGATASDQVKLTVSSTSPENAAPLADAGTDQTLTAASEGTALVNLDGSASSDSDGSISSYLWTMEGGEVAKGVNPIISLSQGIHNITLTVTDNEGATDEDEVVIKVNAVSGFAAPSNLLAQGVSSNQINLSWQDNTDDEEKFILERATNPDFTGSVAYINLKADRTSYEDKRKATDVVFYYRIKAVKESISSPYSNFASAAASFSSKNKAPLADAGKDQSLSAGEDGKASVTLDGSASSDADGSIISYSWTAEGEEIAAEINPTLMLSVGTHVITLTVSDNEGATDSDEVTVTVREAVTDLVAPSGLTAQGVSSSQINLSWQDNAAEEEGFVLERATNSDFSGSVAYINIPPNTSSYEDKNKVSEVKFYYRLKAVKGDISSDYSGIATASASSSAGPAMRLAGSENLDDQNETIKMKEELSLYPNPVGNEFTVELSNEYEGSFRLMLFDPTGRKLMEREFVKTSIQHKEKLQLTEASLPQGIYFLKLVGQGMEMSQVRLIKK